MPFAYISRLASTSQLFPMQRCASKKNCSPALRNVPMSRLSESNPPLLRNKEDQMASSISQGFALCNSRQNYEEPFYVLGWDKILVTLLSEYVSQPL